MEDRLDLDQIERETWAHQLKDGIFDITFGWLFMWANFMDHQIYFGLPETAATILHLLPLVVYFLGRKYISEPRIGKVRHNLLTSPIRKKTLIPFLIPLVIFGGLYLWDKKVHLGWFVFGGLDLTGPLLFTAAIVISSAVMAVAMKNWRMFYYMSLLSASIIAIEIVNYIDPTGEMSFYPPAIACTIIIIVGVAMFINFLKKYPKSQIGVPHEQ